MIGTITKCPTKIGHSWATPSSPAAGAHPRPSSGRELGAYTVRKFGTIELQELQPMAIEKALNEIQDGGRTPDYRTSAWKASERAHGAAIAFTVHGCLQTAVRGGLLTMNPWTAWGFRRLKNVTSLFSIVTRSSRRSRRPRACDFSARRLGPCYRIPAGRTARLDLVGY